MGNKASQDKQALTRLEVANARLQRENESLSESLSTAQQKVKHLESVIHDQRQQAEQMAATVASLTSALGLSDLASDAEATYRARVKEGKMKRRAGSVLAQQAAQKREVEPLRHEVVDELVVEGEEDEDEDEDEEAKRDEVDDEVEVGGRAHSGSVVVPVEAPLREDLERKLGEEMQGLGFGEADGELDWQLMCRALDRLLAPQGATVSRLAVLRAHLGLDSPNPSRPISANQVEAMIKRAVVQTDGGLAAFDLKAFFLNHDDHACEVCQGSLHPMGRWVPQLPPWHVDRSDLVSQGVDALLGRGGSALSPTPRVVVLHGAAGSGKSMLAAALCQHPTVRGHFAKGFIVWVSPERARRLLVAYHVSADARGVAQLIGSELCSLVDPSMKRTILPARSGSLIVLDGADYEENLRLTRQLVSILPEYSAVLLTTRDSSFERRMRRRASTMQQHSMASPAAKVKSISTIAVPDGLEAEEATRLCEAIRRMSVFDFSAIPNALFSRVCESQGNSPLGVVASVAPLVLSGGVADLVTLSQLHSDDSPLRRACLMLPDELQVLVSAAASICRHGPVLADHIQTVLGAIGDDEHAMHSIEHADLDVWLDLLIEYGLLWQVCNAGEQRMFVCPTAVVDVGLTLPSAGWFSPSRLLRAVAPGLAGGTNRRGVRWHKAVKAHSFLHDSLAHLLAESDQVRRMYEDMVLHPKWIKVQIQNASLGALLCDMQVYQAVSNRPLAFVDGLCSTLCGHVSVLKRDLLGHLETVLRHVPRPMDNGEGDAMHRDFTKRINQVFSAPRRQRTKNRSKTFHSTRSAPPTSARARGRTILESPPSATQSTGSPLAVAVMEDGEFDFAAQGRSRGRTVLGSPTGRTHTPSISRARTSYSSSRLSRSASRRSARLADVEAEDSALVFQPRRVQRAQTHHVADGRY